jgi:Fe2+ or Zn2+ uptake regulation protein
MEEKFLKLANTVYKALEFFPEQDPLKNRAKDKVLEIMDNLALVTEVSGWTSLQHEKVKVNILDDIDVLLGYLWIGKTQGWLNSVNYLIIANEYEKIRAAIGPVIELTQKLPGLEIVAQSKPPVLEEKRMIEKEEVQEMEISERQQKIIEFLTKNEKAQVMDLQTVLPDVTKRTIRRDLDELLENNKISREGDFNQVVYKIKG